MQQYADLPDIPLFLRRTPVTADAETEPSWRDLIPVHPAADLFPMMGDEELRALGEDIKKNGLTSPIVLWKEGVAHSSSITREGFQLLDGRNRLGAAERAGLKIELDEKGHLTFDGRWVDNNIVTTDPYTFVLSANVHRRHLTGEQRRDLIAKVLVAQPKLSNRRLGKLTGAHHTTVGSVRDAMEGRGEISHVSKREDSAGRQQPATKRAAPKQVDLEEAVAALPREGLSPKTRERLDALRTKLDAEEDLANAKDRLRALDPPKPKDEPEAPTFVRRYADYLHRLLVKGDRNGSGRRLEALIAAREDLDANSRARLRFALNGLARRCEDTAALFEDPVATEPLKRKSGRG